MMNNANRLVMILAFCTCPVWAQNSFSEGDKGSEEASKEAVFTIANNENTPVIQLQLNANRSGRAQQHAYLQVYGTGTVRVAKPGSRSVQSRIQREEVHKLVALLSSKGVMAFDEQNALTMKTTMDNNPNAQRAPADSNAHHYEDDRRMVIDINLDSYQAPNASRAVTNFQKQVTWVGLSADARKYPSIRSIQFLNEAVNALLEMAEKQK